MRGLSEVAAPSAPPRRCLRWVNRALIALSVGWDPVGQAWFNLCHLKTHKDALYRINLLKLCKTLFCSCRVLEHDKKVGHVEYRRTFGTCSDHPEFASWRHSVAIRIREPIYDLAYEAINNRANAEHLKLDTPSFALPRSQMHASVSFAQPAHLCFSAAKCLAPVSLELLFRSFPGRYRMR